MAASSLSVAAAAALPTSSHSLSSTPIDHFSLKFSICKLHPIRTASKFNALLKYSLFSSSSSLYRSSVQCAPTAFDGVELNEEEEPSDGAPRSVSEAEEETGVPQLADGGRLYVGNLPFTMTSSQLSEIFAEAGRVISAEVWNLLQIGVVDLHLLL